MHFARLYWRNRVSLSYRRTHGIGTPMKHSSDLAGAQSWQEGLGVPDSLSRDNAKGKHIHGEKGTDGGLSGAPVPQTVERKILQ